MDTPNAADELLNTAKQADPANAGAHTRAQLTPKATTTPQPPPQKP